MIINYINYVTFFVILTLLLIQNCYYHRVFKNSIKYRNFYRPKIRFMEKSYSLLAANHLDLLQDLDGKVQNSTLYIDLTDNYFYGC